MTSSSPSSQLLVIIFTLPFTISHVGRLKQTLSKWVRVSFNEWREFFVTSWYAAWTRKPNMNLILSETPSPFCSSFSIPLNLPSFPASLYALCSSLLYLPDFFYPSLANNLLGIADPLLLPFLYNYPIVKSFTVFIFIISDMTSVCTYLSIIHHPICSTAVVVFLP